MTLEEKLALSKEQKQIMENGIKAVQHKQARTVSSNSPIVGNLDDIDKAVYGEVEKTSGYDPHEEMKRIKERRGHGGSIDYSHSKLPRQIIESIAANPLDMTVVDPKMDAFTEKLKQTLPNSFNRSYEIQEKLEKQDRQELNEVQGNNNTTPASVNVDYELIKTIVESVVDKKINELKKGMVNENLSYGSNSSLKAMKLGEKFLFLDSDNNIFECQMKYIGKNKKRKS
jgi:hypothetical protein